MRFSLFLYLILSSIQVFSQELEDFTLSEIKEEIFVNSLDSGYSKVVEITGAANDEDKWFSIYYDELDEVEIVSVTWENYKGKMKSVDIESIYETDVSSSSFFSGIKASKIPIHKTSKFVVNYTLKNPYAFLLGGLSMTSTHPTKKITKNIILPLCLQLHYDLPDIDWINPVTITVDSVNNTRMYTFSSNPVKDKEKDLPRFHYSVSGIPIIRMIITKNGETPETCLNNTITKINDSVCQLSEESQKFTDSLTSGLTSELEIARECYTYLQHNFNYITIVNGLDALQPTDVNITLSKHIGDCKDMAMLLVSMLRHKEIDAYYAIVPSTDYNYNMDFSSIASANHVICTIKNQEGYMILDATDRLCDFGEPSMHTQGETMFIVSGDGWEKYVIPETSPEKNLIRISLDLEHDQNLKGTYTFTLKGKSKSFYKYLRENEIASRQRELSGYFISMFMGNANWQIGEIIENDSNMVINASIEINKSYLTRINQKLYLNPSFIARPYYFEPGDKDPEVKIILPFAFESQVDCNIHFSENWLMPEPSNTKLNAGDFSGFFATAYNDKDQLNISSGFRCSKIEYFPDEIDSLRKITDDFEKLYHNAIKLNKYD